MRTNWYVSPWQPTAGVRSIPIVCNTPQFRRRIEGTLSLWRAGFAKAIHRAQKAGIVREDVNPRRVAAFLVEETEGSFGAAKCASGRVMLRSNLEMLAA